MANWAKLQEDLVGLPVAKRAKHGIHFDNGDGQVLAHFSGKPCHYEDAGLWKPIDTKLLVTPDGFYGCPHSPVKVHKDGRVKVDKSDYSQFTELPGSPVGKVDGDRIVRKFPGGRQYLYVTEDGFREEIVVDKPTFPLEKFIGKTSGTLPSAYKASPQTAVDANGDVFEITSDTKALGDWLDGAVYPVTIDPDFSVQPDETAGVDTFIISSNPDTNYGTDTKLSVYGTNYHRSLIKFDLSTLAGTTISAATLELTTTNNKYSAATLYIHRVLVGNAGWTEAGATWNKQDGTNNWAGSAGCSSSGTDYAAATLYALDPGGDANDQTKSLSLDTTEFTTLVSANYGMLLRIATNFARKDWHSSSSSTASYRPVLTVTYTAAGGFHPINMTAQMQNLTGNMRG